MANSSIPSSASPRGLSRFHRRLALTTFYFPKVAAFSLLLVYTVVALAGYFSTLRPASLAFRTELCMDTPCVSSVAPGSAGWFFGVRPGMVVLAINDRALSSLNMNSANEGPIRQATLLTARGEVLNIAISEQPPFQSRVNVSLWILGGAFALLGAAVVLRRPDLQASRMFWLFAGVTALGLAGGPSSGAGHAWARILVSPAFVGIGALILPFAFALTADRVRSRDRLFVLLFASFGLVLIGAFVVSLFAGPLFQLVRPAILLYVAVAVVTAVGLLAARGIRQRSPAGRQQARIVLSGIALGTLPFVSLTLVPQSLGFSSLVPDEFSVLTWAIVPASVTYAILQHQLMGIRKLVHRGMVYSIATFAMLIVVVLVLTLVTYGGIVADRTFPPIAISVALVGGILLFLLLCRGARWLVDTLV